MSDEDDPENEEVELRAAIEALQDQMDALRKVVQAITPQAMALEYIVDANQEASLKALEYSVQRLGLAAQELPLVREQFYTARKRLLSGVANKLDQENPFAAGQVRFLLNKMGLFG